MPPTFFSKNVDLKLIELVKDHPVLYNPRHPKYTDSDTREVTWQKIGDILSRPAAEFAGIQCQIHFGDFQEDKHKAGFIENLKEYLPEQYVSSWGVEKKVLKEHRKHPGLSAVDAKHLYTKRARALPTYGVTFFLVKEKQKDKKKLVPRLLGINKEAILRLDEVSKEILQEWPLTHVKTYHVAKGEIFTLNFGDYSDKEYSVKTRDAYRIRDILEDYIDLIRKRMMEQYHSNNADSAYVMQDNIQASQANIMTLISNNPSKLVEQSFVGPSKIVQHEAGKAASQGTQIMTIKQIVVSEKGNHHQQGVKSEVGMRGDMSIPFTRRLNRLNSNSVKIVTLLTEPTKLHIEDARKVVAAMNGELSYIRDGVKETIDKQTSDEEKKKLQDQMNELNDLMRLLTSYTDPDTTEAGEAGDAAMKVADLTTRMYFSLDEKQRRRSKIISRSRASFVEDENTQKTLRKASFIAATTTAVHAVDQSNGILDQNYTGPLLDPQRTAELEAASVDKLGKMNAAIAHYIMAHSDPKNVDYEAAVNSMHTIHELMPEFAKDTQALASNKDLQSQSRILQDAKMLCDAIKRICSSTGMEDPEKVEKAVKDYTEASSRLVFTFGKGQHSEKENELLDLVDEVGGECSKLLLSAQQLTQVSEQAAAATEVDAAGARAATAAKALIAQVQLTAPTIAEPHCQSAVTAGSEALSATVQQLAAACKPLVEPPAHHQLGETIHHQVMDLARALDRLKNAYSGIGGDEEGDVFEQPAATQTQQRLKFINTLTANNKQWNVLGEQCAQPHPTVVTVAEAEEAQRRLSDRMGHLNAAIAALLASTADRDRPDYVTAEVAVNTINELMPQVVHDTKVASANQEAAARAAMMDHVRRLCEASQAVAACSEDTTPQARSDAIAKFTNASGKLVFGISHRGNPRKENQILELSEDACQKVSQLLSGVQALSQVAEGEAGGVLDARGASCADSAQSLLNTAQLTAASMAEPRCRSALLASVDKLSSSGQELASAWSSLKDQPQHSTHVQGLETTLGELEGKLDLLKACVSADDLETTHVPNEHKLQFVKTLSATREQIQKAEKALDKPLPPSQNAEKAAAIQRRLSGRLGELNAAMAALAAAAAPERARYGAADDAARTIANLVPFVVQDTQSTCANKDAATRAAMLDLIRELCEASRGVCVGVDGTDAQGLSDALSKYSNASGKLVYVVSPRANADRENQITGLTAGACSAASQLLAGVERLSLAAGGAQGEELDARGAALAGDAQALLTTAQITSPSISEPHCKNAMLASIDKVSSSSEKLANSWSPLLQDPRHQKQVEDMQPSLKRLEHQLETLRKACHAPDVEHDGQMVGQMEIMDRRPELQKLQFVKTMSSAKEQLHKAEKALDKPIPPPQSSDMAEAVQLRLSGRLGDLNAAIAALLAATADCENPDYKKAEQAIKTISDTMPAVVQDTQSTCANKDAATRAAMLDLIRELCEASRGVCAGVDGPNAQGLNDAVSKFSDASGKLVFVTNPRNNAEREKQILALSKAACTKTDKLLSCVQKLETSVEGKTGQELEAKGRTVDGAARAMLSTAKVTAPSISSPACQAAMLSSVDRVSASAGDLVSSWKPLLAGREWSSLRTPLQQLEGDLDDLRRACRLPNGDLQITKSQPIQPVPANNHKLEFVKSVSGAKEQIQKAQKALDKPLPPPQNSEKADAIQRRLSGRLGELNAAIAALLAATSDREKPDYKSAEQAARNITELMPYVVQDTQSTCANKDAATRAAMLDLIRELCEASRGVCAGVDETNAQGLNDAVSKFSAASGKLVYVVSPAVNEKREKQIIGLAAGACSNTSQLLSGVEQLSHGVGGVKGQELDAKGAMLADAAQNLLATSQITASSLSSPPCKQALQSSIDRASSCSLAVSAACQPLLQDPHHQVQALSLQVPLQQLDAQLEAMRKACQIPDEVKIKEVPLEQQKLHFKESMVLAKEQIQKAQKALDKPLPPPQNSEKADAIQQRLSGRLGELNAAIAALLAATSDREKPDYKSAEQAARNITELMPYVVQDTQSTCTNKDAATRAAMLDLIRELCEASRGVCAGLDGTNTQDLNDAVSKFSAASGKLVYVVSPAVNEKREKQIIGLAAGACSNTSQLLSGVEQLSHGVGGVKGQELDAKGTILADAAQNLLATSQITASSLSSPPCEQALQSSIDRASSCSLALSAACQPLLQDPHHQVQALSLQVPLQQLDAQLKAMRKACQIPDEVKIKEVPLEQQKLHLKKSMDVAKEQIQDAQKALARPLPPALGSEQEVALQHKLSGRLGELNAAIADLLSAPADRNKPYYETAEKAVKTIADLLPEVIQETHAVSASKDAATRAAMLHLLKELCEASGGVCASADGTDPKGLGDAVGKFSDASGKLVYVVSPNVDADREQQIVELSAGACNLTSQLLSGVQQLSEAVGGATARDLDERGADLADGAQALLASAQVTAPSISSPQCKASLLSTIELVSSGSQELSACWQPLLQEPRHQQRAAALQQGLRQLHAQLAALRRACGDTDHAPGPHSAPSTPTRRASRLPPPPAPPRTVSIVGEPPAGNRAHYATKEFLDRLRCEESQAYKGTSPSKAATSAAGGVKPPPAAVMTDDEKRMHQQFLLSIDDADKSIRNAEETVRQSSQCQEGAGAVAVSAGECMAKQARLQRNIALAGVEVAALVGANYADTIDYTAATKSTKAMPQLMTAIVEDGKVLASTVGQESRQAFLEDMLQLCHSTRKLCDAAKNDRENLNEAAVEFGDKSTKLLYVISNDVDPTLEKEIITRAKAIGDGVAQISVKAGEVASGPGGGEGAVGALCSAGARCQDVAGKLIYTAKLVAPSIYEPPCQDALLRSADTLSSELRNFSTTWKPFSAEPHHAKTVRELAKEAENLERILEGLKSDVKGGRIGQRREIERLVVEDTPMRQLTLKIMEDAKKLSVCSELSPALRREYNEYSKQLSDALRSLDLANARCKRTPHDTNKRRELEKAIQNLQVILLQTRPSRSDKEKSNIVDLRDFIDEVSTEADKMAATAIDYKVPTAADKKILQDINASGQQISRAAYKLTHTDDAAGFDTSFEDILDVDQFGQACDDIITDMIARIQTLEDVKTRNALLSKILPLSESCNMLRFATKSGISDSKSVSLDSTLDDLDDIESRVIPSIVKDKSESGAVALRFAPPAPPPGRAAAESLARSELCRAVCSRQGCAPRAPLTAYIATCAAATGTHADNRNRLLRHLYKLVHLLKTQTVVTSKRIATWQSIDDPEVSAVTEQILQEIQNPEEKFQAHDSKVKKILNDSDLTKLLIPSPAKIVGSQKQQDQQLMKLSTKLNSMCGALTLSVASPEALARSAHAASEAAIELSAVARGCKDHKEAVQCSRIEESVQEMTFTTYGVLKAAELACLDAANPLAKRRLMDACRNLDHAINKMVSSSSAARPLQQGCGAMSRALSLHSAALQSPPAATSALPFHECCAALDQHQEVVYKLKSDQPMTRQEFARSLHEVNEAVCRTTEISSQCAYLISVSEKDSEIAKKGPVDVPRIQKTIESLQDSCMAIIGASSVAQAKEETDDLHKRVQDFSRALDEAQMKVKEGGAKATLTRAKGGVTTSAATLWDCLKEQNDMDKVTSNAVNLLEEVNRSHCLIERCPLVPSAGQMSAETKARCDDLCNHSKSLLSHTLSLVRDVEARDDDGEMLTWVTFTTNKTKLLDAYDALLKSIRVNGQRAGIIEGSPEAEVDEDAQSKTYLDVQVDLANKWLLKPMSKAEVKANGQQAVRRVIDIATKMSEDLKGSEREEIRQLITETEELLAQCSARYDNEKYSVLVDRVKELKKSIQRGVVTRLVEDFIEDGAGAELDLMVDLEEDEQKRKFLLERKIAELLAQLGRVTRTARFVADAGGSQKASAEIARCTEQTELLAPMLVQAAQERIASPNDQAVVANYKALLAKYAESVSKVRSMCDCAVDPMDFVQTAGETMQRLREESSAENDVQRGQRTSEAIIKLANRSIDVSMSSLAVRRDPEVRAALQAAQTRLRAATPAANTRRSRLPDWKESTAEVLRTTGEVECALGGENIFKKQPTAQGTNQQIYSVARELHESVREWSSRDNEIVGVARRMAVLMARLSEYMETDKKQALISTSKSIVAESHEVAALARKLAHECTDVRIKTNLLQTCERIPTISAQLKMLTTVKGSSLGQQGSKEDTEAMDMLVVNAQSLMQSIQEVVKAAAGASVKIMSQRGPRLRWVRKNYY